MMFTQSAVLSHNLKSLSEERRALRQDLQSQRQLISLRIEPTRTDDSEFPRSIAMRFLLRRVLIVRLLLEVLKLLIAARRLKSTPGLFLLGRISFSALPTPPMADQ